LPPQRVQNAIPKRSASGTLYSITSCSPRVSLKSARFVNMFVVCAALRARRQREQ
jgi:hypothetical protein